MPISETYNLDVMEYLKGVESGAFDLAIADPPYGIGDRLSNGGGGGGWQNMVEGNSSWDEKPDPAFFVEVFRVSKNQIIWGGNHFVLPPCECPICWDKVRPNQKNVGEWEYAWTSFTARAQMFRYCNNGGFLLPEPRIHITQKPVALYKWLLQNYARPGDKIFDPMMGSQSSRIAAWDMGFDYVGCEMDFDYFKDGEARFKKHVANKTTLFAPEQMYNFEQTKLEF